MKKFIKLLMLAVLFTSLSGCASFAFVATGSSSPRSAGGGQLMSVPGLSNNSETQLKAGSYKGLTITENKVVLTGQGPGRTVIQGNVIIKGNSCVIRNLTIKGNVIIEGNNANLVQARIQGDVRSPGNNNSW